MANMFTIICLLVGIAIGTEVRQQWLR